MTVALVLAALSLAIWVALSLSRARRWPRDHVLPTAAPPQGDEAHEVRAVVPARNEAASLPRPLPALRQQAGGLASVTVVDDRSTDETGAVARRLGRENGGEGVLEVVSAPPLPPGWAGKVHAMHVGVHALEGSWGVPPGKRWVFFTDADIRMPPDGIRRFLAQATGEGGPFDLVSVMARLRAESFWEKVLVPAFVWFFHAMYPFRASSRSTSKVASAAGGAMLVRLEALERAGGPAAWRGALIDDLALARGLKDTGSRLWTGFADDVVSTRRYPTLASIVDMVARSAFVELGFRYALIPFVWLALLLVFVVPPAALIMGILAGNVPLAGLGLLGWVLETLHLLPSFRHHRVAGPYALLMPFAAVLYAWMTTVSAWRHLRGRSKAWRPEA